jgi:PEP-CTERM motif-containing protein
MSRSRILVIAAISWLPVFAIAAAANAQTTYNAATDWKSSYATTAAAGAATTATWGTQAQDPGAWSAGVMSWNWTNQIAVQGGPSEQALTTYYNANTVGTETSGGTVKASFTYTVPFQAYQLNPGSSFQQAVGQTFTQQIASGFKPEKNGGADSSAITLPTGITSAGATTGLLNEVGAVKQNSSVTTSWGFTTSAYAVGSKNTFNDGDGSVQDSSLAGVFYNYNTTANAVSSSTGGLNAADSLQTNTLTMLNNFGPSYVAWTAPSGAAGNGTAVITMTAYDLDNADDGDAGFYVITNKGGPTAPLLSAQNYALGGSPGAQNVATSFTNVTDTTGGTIVNGGGGYSSTLGATSGTYTGTEVSWISGSLTITPGEVIYFASDPGHDQYQTHGNHSTGSGTDPIALQVSISYVPEPSSIVLMGLAGVGLAFVARKRRTA